MNLSGTSLIENHKSRLSDFLIGDTGTSTFLSLASITMD